METKFRRIYLGANVFVVGLMLILIVLAVVLPDRAAIYYIGLAARTLLGLLLIYNGIWNACTGYYSLSKFNSMPKWVWWVLLVFGIAVIITVFMGYGFNTFGNSSPN